METFKKFWAWILGAFGLILGLFFFERNGKKQAEAKLESAEFKAKDQVLQYQESEKEATIATETEKLNKLKETHDKTTQSNQKPLEPKQVEEYWKGRNDS